MVNFNVKYISKLIFLYSFFLLSCSSSISRIEVHDELIGQKIDTTVDSQIAKYYVEHYLKNNMSNPEFDHKIEHVLQNQNNTIPSSEFLKKLSDETSVDFAALYLAKSILEAKMNRRFYLKFNEALSKIKTGIKTDEQHLHPNSNSYVFLFIPGWVYESEPENGADFAKP